MVIHMAISTNFKKLCLVFFLLNLLFFFPSVIKAETPIFEPPDRDNKPLIVFAAASLTGPLGDIAKAFEQKTGSRVILSFGSSSALARQLAMGAPASIYISAHRKWVNWLKENNDAFNRPVSIIAQNRLALALRKGPPLNIGVSPQRLMEHALVDLGEKRLIIGDPNTVPLGQYSKEYLIKAGFWETVKNKVAPAKDALSALRLLETGQSDLAILYESDAITSDKVSIITRLTDFDITPIEYLVLSKKTDTEKEGVNKNQIHFMDYLMSPEAQTILKAYGFSPPPAPK